MAEFCLKEQPATWSESVLFAIRSAIPGLHKETELTLTGQMVEITLALLGPVFFALWVLALRGRVKR